MNRWLKSVVFLGVVVGAACADPSGVILSDHYSAVVLRGSVRPDEGDSPSGWVVTGRWITGVPGSFVGPLPIDTTDAAGEFQGIFGIGNGPDSAHVVVTAVSHAGDTLEADLGVIRLSLSDTVDVVLGR